MARPIETQADEQRYAALIDTLSREQLASLVRAELPGNERMVERLDLLALNGNASEIERTLSKRLTETLQRVQTTGYRDEDCTRQALKRLLEQIETELLTINPSAAHRLTEQLIESAQTLFEHLDDSSGSIGELLEHAARLWLESARQSAQPEAETANKALRLFLADEYGAREALLEEANRALSQETLQTLAQRCEQAYENTPPTQSPEDKHKQARWLTAMSLIATALRDPALAQRSMLLRSPNPNPLQRVELARKYLDFGDPKGALNWLDGPWEAIHEGARLRALEATHEALGHAHEVKRLREEQFTNRPSVHALNNWLKALDEPDREQAKHKATEIAHAITDPITGAQILIRLGNEKAAEERIVAQQQKLNGQPYTALIELAEDLEWSDAMRGAIACYRALLEGILIPTRSSAYAHAADYWHRLNRLSATTPSLHPLESHEAFTARIQHQHRRKPAFWRAVDASNPNRTPR